MMHPLGEGQLCQASSWLFWVDSDQLSLRCSKPCIDHETASMTRLMEQGDGGNGLALGCSLLQ
ncbi:MAG: hypothetical protein WBA43_11925 [Elainellaceae cyanobacterium]